MDKEEDPVAETIKTYDNYAERYTKKYGEISGEFEVFEKLLSEFIEALLGKNVLEIGCGPGRDAKYLTEKGISVTALELSKVFFEIAVSNAPKAKVMLMDMRHLEFTENSFDGIWATASFLHIPKNQAKETLLGFHRVLKPGGMMFISVKEGSGEAFVRKDFYKGNAKFFAFYTEPEFKNLLESCGFKIKKILVEKKSNGTWISVFALKE
jgi:SAM-dependent methyltransferase